MESWEYTGAVMKMVFDAMERPREVVMNKTRGDCDGCGACDVDVWFMAADVQGIGGRYLCDNCRGRGCSSNGIERRTPNPGDIGSSPVSPANQPPDVTVKVEG